MHGGRKERELNSDPPRAEALAWVRIHPDPSEWDEATRRHVAVCTQCRETAESSQMLRSRLRTLPSMIEKAPASLREWMAAAQARTLSSGEESASVTDAGSARAVPSSPIELPVARAAQRTLLFRWALPLTLAAGLLLGLGIAPWVGSLLPSKAPSTAATMRDYLLDVTHDHFLIGHLNRSLEVRGLDTAQASGWLSSGLPFPVGLASPPPGWSLEGARIWHTVSRISAMAAYQGPGGERVLVFAVPREGIDADRYKAVATPQGPVYLGESYGNQGVAWFQGDLAWSATSPMDRSRLLEWVEAYRSTLSPSGS